MRLKMRIIFMVALFLLPVKCVQAATNIPKDCIVAIAEEEPQYENWLNCSFELFTELNGSEDGQNAYLYNVLTSNGDIDGYLIVRASDNLLLEYSKNKNPYMVAQKKYLIDGECTYIYGNYEIKDNEEVYTINACGEIIDISSSDNVISEGNGISTYGYVSGTISPQLQNSNNCIVAAISNLIWYYGKNGYSSLIKDKTFASVKSSVDTIITSLGGYANKYIPLTFKSYMGSTYKSATNIGSPSFSTLKSEIDNNYPCLLGFAKGSAYSNKNGHMTVCVGYVRISSDYYSCVIDGHTSQTVTRVWTKYNDYICKVRVK